MKYAIITNIPDNPKDLMDYALLKSFDSWVDELGTKDNPGFSRKPSKLSYEEAFEIIKENNPHWTISFRNQSHISDKFKDYWEFGGGNINTRKFGRIFIWIKIDIGVALEIFKEYDLLMKKY